MSVTVKVKNDFVHLALEVQARLSTAVDMTAAGIKDDAQGRSPDQLGISRKWRILNRGLYKKVVQNGEYRAVFYEHGTPFLPQVAMLAPAVEGQVTKFEKRLKLALEK